MDGPPGVRKDEDLDDECHHEQRPRRKARREAAEQQRGEEVLGKSRQRHRDRRIERQARKFAAEQIILRRIDPEKTSLDHRSEEHTSELQSLLRTSYAVFCLKKKKYHITTRHTHHQKH